MVNATECLVQIETFDIVSFPNKGKFFFRHTFLLLAVLAKQGIEVCPRPASPLTS